MSGMRVVCKLTCCSPGCIAAAHCSTLKDLEVGRLHHANTVFVISHVYSLQAVPICREGSSIPSAAAVFLCRLIAGVN